MFLLASLAISSVGLGHLAAQETSPSLDPSRWKPISSDGVTLSLTGEMGALKLQYDFAGHGGFVLAETAFVEDLSGNFAFTFLMKGSGPRNNLEFKIMDPSGDNVWWERRDGVAWPDAWTRVTLPKRKIRFAWGPKPGPIGKTGSLQFGVSAFDGGHGTLWIKDFRLIRQPAAEPFQPRFSAAASLGDASALRSGGVWRLPKWKAGRVTLDLGRAQEFGGLTTVWRGRRPSGVRFATSGDGERWLPLETVIAEEGRLHALPSDSTARFVAIEVPAQPGEVVLARCIPRPLEFGDSVPGMLESLARELPKGRFPRHLSREQDFWTVVGSSGGKREALLNQEGLLELWREGPSIEPSLSVDGKIVTWADVQLAQSLQEGYLPLPEVRWRGEVDLGVRPFVPERHDGAVVARYTVANNGKRRKSVVLNLRLIPVQATPVWQSLNLTPCFSPIYRIQANQGGLRMGEHVVLRPLSRPSETFVSTYLDPRSRSTALVSKEGLGCGTLAYKMSLRPGERRTISVVGSLDPGNSAARMTNVEQLHRQTISFWKEALAGVRLRMGGWGAKLAHVYQANIAYTLINRDGPMLQPGSRTYERAWTRDGVMMATALLQAGRQKEAVAFLDWLAEYVREDGFVPCVVDRRGADPFVEHDSHGEFIHLVAECYRYTRDLAILRRHYAQVQRVAEYIERVRERGGGPGYEGLLPKSASHEGYAASPQHSYWDDFFALRGLRDAAFLAATLGRTADAQRFDAVYKDMRSCVAASIMDSMRAKAIPYIPGCVELGDFDATSTAIAVFPCAEGSVLPAEMQATLARYWNFFQNRKTDQKWDAYTPYEIRIVSAMLMMGMPERALSMLRWFLLDLLPDGWSHWAEVVRRKQNDPGMIGDMPHSWVGAEFLRSLRNCLVYERESDGALIVGAGLDEDWLRGGMEARPLRTYYGSLELSGGPGWLRVMGKPSGNVFLAAPFLRHARGVSVNGRAVPPSSGMIRLAKLPATIRWNR